MKKILCSLLVPVLLLTATGLNAQEKDSCRISADVTVDMVSSYLWRGLVSDLKPHVQPSVALSAYNFELGIWGSSNFDNTYREVDYWLAYSYKNFTLTFNDYCWSPDIDKGKYFNWNNGSTQHYLELQLDWEGPEKFPVKLTAATFIYGKDKKFPDGDTLAGSPDLKNQYSSYLEASYPFNIQNTEMNVFIGGTPAEGFYAEKAALINIGVSAKKQLPFSDKFSLPISGSLIVNPQEDNVWFVFTLSL